MSEETTLRKYLDETHNPRDLCCHFLRRADARLREWGVVVHVHRDFGPLVDVNAANQGNEWFNLMPMFHPDCFPTGEAFWLEGRARDSGEAVMTQAARCYHIIDDSLADALTSLRLFYAEPAAMKGPDEVCVCNAPSASRLGGKLLYSGGTWARRDWRGKGTAAILPRISRVLALRQWEPDYTISLVDPVLIPKGIVRSYGYHCAEEGVAWSNSPSQGDLDLALIWMDRAELVRDLANCLELAGPIPA